MTTNQQLILQTENTYEWTNRLLASVHMTKWDTLATGIDTNLSWQVGHLIVSLYYHTVMTTVGHNPELIDKLNLRQYTKNCGYDTQPEEMIGTTRPQLLKSHFELMQEHSLNVIRSLSEKDLWSAVEPTKVPHPVAKTKFEAIDWNIKHTFWHCGQIAIWKRVVDQPYDYGIKKPTKKTPKNKNR